MGSCLSLVIRKRWRGEPSSVSGGLPPGPAAQVVTAEGHIRQYTLPISVSQVLPSPVPVPTTSSYFVCNSDSLYYDEFIPAMKADQLLQPHQIYFVLPVSRLQHRLSASDMAALAVKAATALRQLPPGPKNTHTSAAAAAARLQQQQQQQQQRVVDDSYNNSNTINKSFQRKLLLPSSTAPAISRSNSYNRLPKCSSKRAFMAVRSFKLRLNTIYEGSVLRDSFRRSYAVIR